MAKETDIPTEEELSTLSKRALAAFLYRDSKRRQPGFELSENLRSRFKHTLSLARALEMLKEYIQLPASEFQQRWKNPFYVSEEAPMEASDEVDDDEMADIVETIVSAASITWDDDEEVPYFACETKLLADAAVSDYRKLIDSGLAQNDSHFDPSNDGPLGPVWPDGPPNGWPEKVARMEATLKSAREMQDAGKIKWNEDEE